MKRGKRITALLLALLLAIGGMPLPAQAATDESYITEGSFRFTSNDGKLHQGEDHFVFREDCFMRSSFLGCSHLMLLSSQAAQASASYLGGSDGYETDPSQGSRNIEAMLEAMGFEDIESNAYYHQDTRENACGAAMGRRQLALGGKTYTLLAVFPRSMRYQQEWAGNFTVGGGAIHEGLKAARDEVLRFMKRYVEKLGIQGDLKIWIAGHSRGGAISNAVGGFLAGGGAAYLGEALRLAPEDLYCYTYAAPRPVKAGAERQEEMSVSAARKEAAYAADTPGEAYSLPVSGRLDPQAGPYGCIRNYVLQEDLFAQLPPADWGFVHYGTDYTINDRGAGFEDMKAQLSPVSDYLVEAFDKSGSYQEFAWKSVDPAQFRLVPYEGIYAKGDLNTFLRQRLQGLMAQAPTNEAYAGGDLQESLIHAAGLASLLSGLQARDFALEEFGVLVKPLLLTLMAYAAERLQEEKRAKTEPEAVTILLTELINALCGSRMDPKKATVDEALEALARYLADREDSPLYGNMLQALTGIVPESLSGIVRRLLGIFHKDSTLFSPASLEETLKAFIRACAYGADPESSAGKLYPEAAGARGVLFSSLSLLMGGDLRPLREVIGDGGQGLLSEVAGSIMPSLLEGVDAQGQTFVYKNLADAADGELMKLAEALLPGLIERSGVLFGEDVKAEMNRHWQALQVHIGTLRQAVSHMLFYVEGEAFSAEQALVTACTLADNMGLVPLAHYNEVYSAWLKAVKLSIGEEEHSIQYVPGRAADKQKEGLLAHWVLLDVAGKRFYTDRNLSRELMEAELVIPRETEPAATSELLTESGEGEKGTSSQVAGTGGESTALLPQTAPGEENHQDKGPVVLWVALALLAAGGALAGGLILAKKKK